MQRLCPTTRGNHIGGARWGMQHELTARPMPRMSGAGMCRALSMAMPSRARSARLLTKRPSVTLRDMLSQMPWPCSLVACHAVQGAEAERGALSNHTRPRTQSMPRSWHVGSFAAAVAGRDAPEI